MFRWKNSCVQVQYSAVPLARVTLLSVSENTPYPIGFALGSMLYLTFTYIFVLAPG